MRTPVVLRFAVVWDKNSELTAENLFVIPYSQFNSLIHNFYTVVEVPEP